MARESFANKTTAILAMAGSAIGLGNIWRFPYMVGQNGGAAFILVYLLSAIFICVPIFISEAYIGKRTQLSTFGAFEKLAPGTGWKWVGLLSVVTPVIILSFYSVVGGWSLSYLFKSLSLSFIDAGATRETHGAVFEALVGNKWAGIGWLTVFLALNFGVVTLGVSKGIEKFTKITTPILFVLMVAIVFYSLSMPGATAGVDYLIKPDFSKINGHVMLSAMGQAFFSLSLGIGTILTYASYMKKEDNLVSTGLYTAVFDLIFALIAGFAIMPAVFAAGIEPGAGPGLIFETLPYIFSTMGRDFPALSAGVSILFFTAVLFAALTSSVSMLEAGVAFYIDQKKMSRGKATALVFGLCWVFGSLCCVSTWLFNFCDRLTSDFLMTFGSLLFAVFVGWRLKKAEVIQEIPRPIYFVIKWIVPAVIVAIFVSNLAMK